jgi:ATP-dependent Lon protease
VCCNRAADIWLCEAGVLARREARSVPLSGGARSDCPIRRSNMTESDRPGPAQPGRPAKETGEGDRPAAIAGADLLPVLPLRDIVVFPHMIVPLFVGREKSVRALEAVMREDKQILLVAQRNAAQDDPASEDIYRVGTVSTILQLLKLPDGTVKVLVEGGRRARIVGFKEVQAYFEAYVEAIPDQGSEAKELEALGRTVVSQFEQYIKLNKKIAPEVLVSLNQIDDPSKLADTVAAHLNLN